VPPKTPFRNGLLVVLSAANVVSVWFAAQPAEPWHATIHAALAVGFGLWALSRIQRQERGDPAPTSLSDERLDRIERAIDSVAVEVERIGEMERFASKILAARSAELEPRVNPPKPVPTRTDTPR
jgi:hypothetical protein